MSKLLSTSISVGILAGFWTYGSIYLQLVTYAGFLAWASFFAAGGGAKGLKVTLINNLSGVIWGFLIVQISNLLTLHVGKLEVLGIAVAISAGVICWQSRWNVFGFIPGAFIGIATFFATGFNLTGSVIGLVLGALLGYVSEKGGAVLSKTMATSNGESV